MFIMSNTKIINGQVYLTGSIGNIGTLFKATPTISGHYYTFSIGQTEGVFPFGFSLIYNQGSTENVGDFGRGAKFASYQTFQLSGSNIIATNYFGESKTYKLLDEVKVYEEEDIEVTYNYFCHETGTYLREDTSFYYLRDAKGNRTKLRKRDSFIYEYKGIDGSGYIYNENEEKYVGINNSSTIMLQCVNSGPYYDVISVFETYQSTNGTTTTELMSKVVLSYDDDDRICKVVYYKRGNIVESYDLTYTSEGMYMVYKVKDNTRNQVLGFYYEQGNTPKVLIKSYSALDESNVFVSTIDYGHSSYVKVINYDGYKLEYWYDHYGVVLYQVDKYGFIKSYQFDDKKRLVSESNNIQISTLKNVGESINTNSNFESLIQGYNYVGSGYSEYTLEVPDSIIESLYSGRWLKIQSAGYGNGTLECVINRQGYRGDEYTFSTYFYIVERGAEYNNFQVSLGYYDSNNQLINIEYQTIGMSTGDFVAVNISCMANENYSYIKAKISLRAVSTIAVKYFHIYDIPVGSKTKYGIGGRVIYKK